MYNEDSYPWAYQIAIIPTKRPQIREQEMGSNKYLITTNHDWWQDKIEENEWDNVSYWQRRTAIFALKDICMLAIECVFGNNSLGRKLYIHHVIRDFDSAEDAMNTLLHPPVKCANTLYATLLIPGTQHPIQYAKTIE